MYVRAGGPTQPEQRTTTSKEQDSQPSGKAVWPPPSRSARPRCRTQIFGEMKGATRPPSQTCPDRPRVPSVVQSGYCMSTVSNGGLLTVSRLVAGPRVACCVASWSCALVLFQVVCVGSVSIVSPVRSGPQTDSVSFDSQYSN